ncbi:6920_t:CDS:2 [Ambispora gerdemannii]|uniref:6920_t:CDS:1 n=1 Tax=Ambispora gerdemannii TaxID=144530 RepID=A0A9N8WKW6_9GLOM|nr:6920_t:CDS:2 [Ambispora gerdemannii]
MFAKVFSSWKLHLSRRQSLKAAHKIMVHRRTPPLSSLSELERYVKMLGMIDRKYA